MCFPSLAFGKHGWGGCELSIWNCWYSWEELNRRPPDPQSGALNQLCYTCGVGEQCLAPRGPWRRAGVAIADGC
jgi:hypothetical protein